MSDSIALSKKASIERCVKQARDYYERSSDKPFAKDFLKQDAVAINLQRACECCIDLANHKIRTAKLGLPSDSAESFSLLERAGIIDDEMARKMKGMVGFRNILVHQYRTIDLKLMVKVIQKHTDDLIGFAQTIVNLSEPQS